MKTIFYLTCEHASPAIPEKYAPLFTGHEDLLQSHLGWDIGAQTVFECATNRIACLHQKGHWSRLLVDLNRSSTNPSLFSKITKKLPVEEKNLLLTQYYWPYHLNIKTKIQQFIQTDTQVIHLSIHTFSPELHHKIRTNDIGLLYDHKKPAEIQAARHWRKLLLQQDPELKITLNYPYRGTSDGLTTILRATLQSELYVGIELEMNQKHFSNTGECLTNLANVVVYTIPQLLP